MNIENIITTVDELFRLNKGEEAEKLLEESLVEALKKQDNLAVVRLLNELIGYCRETSQVEKSYEYSERVLKVLDRMKEQGTIAYATTLLNIANAYRAGGRLTDSLSYYEQVYKIYEVILPKTDMLLASLHNNVSLLYQEMKEYSKAKEYLKKALQIVKDKEDAYFEEGVTYANLATTCLELEELEEAFSYATLSIAIFEKHNITDTHYSGALSALGTYYYKKEEYHKAKDIYAKAMSGIYASFGENEYYLRVKDNYKACEQALETITIEKSNITGLELCREYYETYGKLMIQKYFSEYQEKIAVGLVGFGSDCFGLDDDISRDHDWGPGFCLWITKETYDLIGKRLEEEYEKLPTTFKGSKRKESKQGKGRMGVQIISTFYQDILGYGNCPTRDKDWKVNEVKWDNIPDYSLAVAVNGHVFYDPLGAFLAIRSLLKNGQPESMWYLKIAESMAKFSQAGQYNYKRMIERNDFVAASVTLTTAMVDAMKLYYYSKRQYPLHDKWLYKGATLLDHWNIDEEVNALTKSLEYKEKNIILEAIATKLSKMLYRDNFISDTDNFLQNHTDELVLKASFADFNIEQLSEMIAKKEFEAFDMVKNEGGRASCQNDWNTFYIMRVSQYLTWNKAMLLQYLYDFATEFDKGHNLVEEKYARMMENTAPDEYVKIASQLPKITKAKVSIIEEIVKIQVHWMEEFEKMYPALAGNARSIHSYEDNLFNTSYETYLRGELSTYSDKMLEMYGRYIVSYLRNTDKNNVVTEIMTNSVKLYGYEDLLDAESKMR